MSRSKLEIGLNDALEQYVGSFGQYQKRVTFFTSLNAVVTGMTLIDIIYLTASPHFWYIYDGEELNTTMIKEKMDVCKMENRTHFSELGTGYWHYDESMFRASIVSRVNSD